MSTGTEVLPDGLLQTNTCNPTFSFDATYLVVADGTRTETMKGRSCVFVGSNRSAVMGVLDELAGRRAPSTTVVSRPVVAVVGYISRPGVIEWRDGLTVEEAVLLAGGPVAPRDVERARSADPRPAIIRARPGIPREIVTALPTDVLLPDDELWVSPQIARK